MNNYIIFILGLIIIFATPLLYSQDLTINEVMSINSTTIADEDGEYPDWIELYNKNNPIDLTGYGLSDDEDNPFKWIFPRTVIQPQEHLLIFASDKDRRIIFSHWETIIDRNDTWKYHEGDASIPSNWNTMSYDDSEWHSGPSGFGYGDGDDATVITDVISIYIRKVFIINDLNNIVKAILHIDYDDGFVAYLNGMEIARANIGSVGIPPPFNQTTSQNREAEIYKGGYPEEYEIDSPHTHLKEGSNILAIQVHNSNKNSPDLSLIPFFSLGLREPPNNPSGFPEILRLQLPVLHTNFKIKSEGETLLLSNPAGTIIDRVELENIPVDISWGRQPDGSSNWNLFYEPTPGADNSGQGYPKIADEPQFSLPGTFYTDNVVLDLNTDSPSATIRYTLDGSEPNESSYVYSEPISIVSTTVVRARTFDPNLLPSKIITQSYFINFKTNLPVFSLSTNPDYFFDVDNGIYTLGNNYQFSNPYYGANFWQDWERPVHIQFFESDGSSGFNMDGGVKIVGGWSRAHPQKGLALFARNKYGDDAINYPLFPDRPYDEFQAFVLRNCGNDWGRSFFSDGLMHELVEDIDLDIIAFRPCLVYINSEYWGILNLREKQNEHYIAMYHDVNPDSIDLLESNATPIHGDARHYNMLIDFITNNDISQPENYRTIKTLMDVDNYIDYNVVQIYFDNRDWPAYNIKYWRPKTENGKWRWLLFDTDWGFGVNGYGRGGNRYGYDYNTLAYATSPQPTPYHHANPPWGTLLLRSLLENKEFKNSFINRFADYFNTIFQPEVVVNKIHEIETLIEPEIQQHINKWNQSYPLWSEHQLHWNDMNKWYDYIQIMIDFANNRIPHMRNHIIDKFKLNGHANIGLDVSPTDRGLIKINTTIVEEFPWQGNYFMNTPIQITAIPYPNYKFLRWTGLDSSYSDTIIIELTEDASLTAIFEPKTEYYEPIVFNEINYNSNENFDPEDWIELYNKSESPIELSGWKFKDSNDSNIFHIPTNTRLDRQEYLVLCRDTSNFTSHFPKIRNIIGNFDSGLNRTGELIRLYDETNMIIDSVVYTNRHPWPIMADGGGPTLELKNPELDNSLSINWTASKDYGTPGTKNSNTIELSINSYPQPPEKFILYSNYPNPFNRSTTIHYELPELLRVNISIYNICGQLVQGLMNEKIQPGYHLINWDAKNLSAGIYIYTISAGKYSATGKCLLLK